MPKPARTAALSAALLAVALAPASAAHAVEVTPGPAPVQVDALRWVDGQPRLETRTAPGPAAAARLVTALERDPAVSDAQPRTTYAVTPPTTAPGTAPLRRALLGTDPYLRYAYHLTSVDAYAAWTVTRGAGVKVAVLDTGVDATQPDLAGRVVPLGNFTTEAATTIGEHGTEVATVIAGAYQNSVGAAGVAPEVTILAGKVCAVDGCASDAVVRGITAAVEAGADVVNLSLGGDTYNRTTAATIQWAIARGVVVVASAGNSGDKGNPVEYPASYDGVVSVSASTSTGAAATWAQHNSAVDLSAPGEAVPAGQPGTGGTYPYVAVSGTSFSGPQVAAAAALLTAVAPAADVATIEGWLKGTTTPQSWGPGYGTGMLDVAAAVQAAQAVPVPVQSAPVTVERGTRSPRHPVVVTG
ncbi:S8 family serine peptidase [Kineococcus rhizosphaerae]|uniref:Subtilase family protein n=1 Tax=Kineococcus rhizosphaerae TaxID=559628 RepID=A0A2T0R2A7_9ACTN|nr:S8 family serine peptidase [Kineococcus rhizosphaerae]PRY13911.1 subtilase family protein [Kineococcus rhizosphaerae]